MGVQPPGEAQTTRQPVRRQPRRPMLRYWWFWRGWYPAPNPARLSSHAGQKETAPQHCALPTAACARGRRQAEMRGRVVRVVECRRRAGRPGQRRGAGSEGGDGWRRADVGTAHAETGAPTGASRRPPGARPARGPSCSSVGGLAASPLRARAEVSEWDGLRTKPEATRVTEACNPRSTRHSRVVCCID